MTTNNKENTTPRIEEMVEELKRKHPCIVTDKMAIGNQSDLYIDLFSHIEQALTEAHQAGIDEAGEVVKKHLEESGGMGWSTDDWYDSWEECLEALQDNK